MSQLPFLKLIRNYSRGGKSYGNVYEYQGSIYYKS